MKKIWFSCMAIPVLILSAGFLQNQSSVTGAWHSKKGTVETVAVFQDGYFSISSFDKGNKKFIRTWGGSFTESGGQLHANREFDTEQKDEIGKHNHIPFNISENELRLTIGGLTTSFSRIDNGNSGLAGNWRITARMVNGEMQQMQRGARKTLKLLSGTRFQWMAINPETKEFSGTGGGTYTFKDGKYTEHIEFFSRDSSRVGASLSFDGSVSGNVWTHKGLSSRGDPIHEEWTREQ